MLHPHLLSDTTLDRKRDIGFITPEEEVHLEAQEEEEWNAQEAERMTTRRSRSCANVKDKEPKKVEPPRKFELTQYQKADKMKRKKLFEQFGMSKLLEQITTMHAKKDVEALINVSVKTQFLLKLMQNLKAEGHRLLIFSMSKKMLDLLEIIFQKKEHKFLRIDGDTEIASREQLCKQFNSDPSIFCCILTTKVGGFGLNLTGADRAVILDPDWNPANDNQAVDRCYRIGQKRDVIVYRLVSIGGLEERIYRRQVYKKGMNLQTIEGLEADAKEEVSDEKAFQKYFNDSDLTELFKYTDDDDNCETLGLIMEKDGFPYEKTPTNVKHISYLMGNKDIVKGISLNSNLYTAQEEEEEKEDEDSLEIYDSPIRERPRHSIYTDDLDQLSKPYSMKRDERVEGPEPPRRRTLRAISDSESSSPRGGEAIKSNPADVFKRNPTEGADIFKKNPMPPPVVQQLSE